MMNVFGATALIALLIAGAAFGQGVGLGLGMDDARHRPGGGGPPPACSNALDFSDGCNSQYLGMMRL